MSTCSTYTPTKQKKNEEKAGGFTAVKKGGHDDEMLMIFKTKAVRHGAAGCMSTMAPSRLPLNVSFFLTVVVVLGWFVISPTISSEVGTKNKENKKLSPSSSPPNLPRPLSSQGRIQCCKEEPSVDA